ncbi:MAG: DUF4301 family protein [Bacteroidales bacterium]
MTEKKDLEQLRKKGIGPDQIQKQIDQFRTGFPFADLVAPATPEQGIFLPEREDEEHFLSYFSTRAPANRILRFVPASGAASRMFKSLFAAMEAMEGMDRTDQTAWVEGRDDIRTFLRDLESYAFFEDLDRKGDPSPLEVLGQILGPEGLDYGSLPKGLLKFHKYAPRDRRTAFEEHIREAASYAADGEGVLRMHLTVSPDHLEGFKAEAARVVPKIEKESGLQIRIDFSFQLPETDTLAVDPDNVPFRTRAGELLFRPGGHGALIRNLDALDADLVFISNIDNVCPDRNRPERVHYKQLLGGILLESRDKVFSFLSRLESRTRPDRQELNAMTDFLRDRMGFSLPTGLEGWPDSDLAGWLIRTLNRPIRVCGMVRNEGEPGGGPFYVRSGDGDVSLQIVEGSQIDPGDPEQQNILNASTHFNPVDLVCSLRDHRGGKFSLPEFVDPDTGFISEKSMEGRPLKALELPGLWNGAMARWLTVFVEVPLGTFSPVKTVFDLVRPEHRA